MSWFFRWFVAIPLAAIVTLFLFLMVANQIAPQPFIYRSADDPDKTVFFNLIICDCGGWWPHPTSMSPPPPADESNAWTQHDKAAPKAPRVDAEKPAMPKIDTADSRGLRYCDGAGGFLDPAAPRYPKACIEKRAEGAVIVGFDITKEGRVVNASIIDSPDRCFNRAVLQAMLKRRYPRLCDGADKPVARRGEQEVFRFALEN